MADQSDVRAQKMARAEFARRGLDTSRADMYARNGVLFIRGRIVAMDAQSNDVEHSILMAEKALRGRPEIRQIITEIRNDEPKPVALVKDKFTKTVAAAA